MAEATYRHGTPLFIDHTAEADIAEGEVVLIGNTTGLTCGVAHRPIANGNVGALAVGGGVYEMVNLNNAANGAKVYFDGTKATTTSTNNATFGFVVRDGSGGANTNCLVFHHPYV